MKLQVVFEVGRWKEMEHNWVFKSAEDKSMIILVDEDIKLVELVEKLHLRLGLATDTTDLLLSFMMPVSLKRSPIYITTDEELEIFMIPRNEEMRLCTNQLKIVIVPKDNIAAIAPVEDVDVGFHDSCFNVDFLVNDQVEVRSRSKLPVFRNVEEFGVESSQGNENLSGDEEDGSQQNDLTEPPPIENPKNDSSSYTFGDGSDLHEGQYFSSKRELKSKLTEIAMKGNFEYRTKKSNRTLWVIECIDPSCSWRLRASKIAPESPNFVVRKYSHMHSCSLVNRTFNHRQATYVVVGQHVAPQYVGGSKGPAPKDVQNLVRTNLNTQISYFKAWRGRKHAQNLIRGTPEDSFSMLPSYFYMIEEANPGTVTRIEVDAENRFKYCFLAFGASIKGFRFMRKVIGIDGTFLKGPFKGVLLVATAQDGNSKCYPLAWGIVDSENTASWTWFLMMLNEVIDDTDDLVLVSDRAQSIKSDVACVFPNAVHGACAWHVGQNIKSKYKCGDIMGSYWKAVNCYRVDEFRGYMMEIGQRYPNVYEYLEKEVGFEKWTKCHFPGIRYNITTTNMVESINSMLLNARDFPYIALFDVIQEKMSKWWNNRRNKGMSLTSRLTPRREVELRKRYAEASGLSTVQLNEWTYHVRGGAIDGLVVDLRSNTCTCREFDLDKLPCVHAIAAAQSGNFCLYDFASPYYGKEYYVHAYHETIYPAVHRSQWNVPNSIASRLINPPEQNTKKKGRPRYLRFPSAGEYRKRKNQCKICKEYGHYQKKCPRSRTETAESTTARPD